MSARSEHAHQAPGPGRGLPGAVRAAARAGTEPHIETSRPGELVGIDCFFVGRPARRARSGLADHGDRYPQLVAWADLVVTGPKGPDVAQTSALARRVAVERQAAAGGWNAYSATTATEFGRRAFDAALPDGVRHSQIRSGRPQTNSHVERLQRTILEECWRPAFARYLQVRFKGLQRDLAHYLHDYHHVREHHGRITAGRRPAELVYGARKMEPR